MTLFTIVGVSILLVAILLSIGILMGRKLESKSKLSLRCVVCGALIPYTDLLCSSCSRPITQVEGVNWVRTVGLFRCCVQTAMETTSAIEGQKLRCNYCTKGFMVFRNGSWERDKEKCEIPLEWKKICNVRQ